MANLEFAQVSGVISFDPLPEPVEAYGFLLPETFKTYFLIEDSEFDRRWSVELEVKILEAGTASALSVTTRGFTNAKSFRNRFLQFEDLEPVKREQIETTKTQLKDLLAFSLLTAIEYFRYEGTKEEFKLPVRVSKASLDSGIWELGSKGYANTDTKTLRREIDRYQDRRAISQEEHLVCARIVAEEFAQAQKEKRRSRSNEKVGEWFGITSGGAEYRVSKARESGYLTKDNKVSTPKVGRKKKK